MTSTTEVKVGVRVKVGVGVGVGVKEEELLRTCGAFERCGVTRFDFRRVKRKQYDGKIKRRVCTRTQSVFFSFFFSRLAFPTFRAPPQIKFI